MMLFLRFIWPRSWRSLFVWVPLVAVGIISCVGLSLAMGFRSGLLAQQASAVVRDGPPGLQPRTQPVDGPLRSSSTVTTGYGPLVATVFWGEAGQRLDLPGIPRVEASGTALASPAVLAQLEDDWTGEIGGWLGDRPAEALPDAALAHPREMVIVEFTDTVPSDIASRFHPVRAGRVRRPVETGFVVLGLLILVLPSVALARAGAAVHLDTRSRRYGLLRALGTPPRRLAAAIAADMAIPMLAGALVGSIVYAAVMSSLGSFTLAGSSYWASDLRLPVTLAVALPLVVVIVGLSSTAWTVHRASRDPVGTLRRDRRRRVPYLSYLSAAGAVAGPIAMFAGHKADPINPSGWLITGGLLLSIVGLEGLSRIAVAVAGRALVSRTRAQIAGSRLSRSGADALLGVSATAVVVLMLVFVVYSNFQQLLAPIGDFDVAVNLPNTTQPGQIVDAVAGFDGVTRVVPVGEFFVAIDEYGTGARVYTMTCDDARDLVKLDAPCAVGSIYPTRRLTDADTVALEFQKPDASRTPRVRFPLPDAVYPVGGQAAASWIPTFSSLEAVLIVDQWRTDNNSLILVTTDGNPRSLRRVIEGLRNRPEESYATTQAALTTGIYEISLIYFPYLFVMATTAAGMAAVTLLYAVLLLFPPTPRGVQNAPLPGRHPDAAGRGPGVAVRRPADTRLRAGHRLRRCAGRLLQHGVRRPRAPRKPTSRIHPGHHAGGWHDRNSPDRMEGN